MRVSASLIGLPVIWLGGCNLPRYSRAAVRCKGFRAPSRRRQHRGTQRDQLRPCDPGPAVGGRLKKKSKAVPDFKAGPSSPSSCSMSSSLQDLTSATSPPPGSSRSSRSIARDGARRQHRSRARTPLPAPDRRRQPAAVDRIVAGLLKRPKRLTTCEPIWWCKRALAQQIRAFSMESSTAKPALGNGWETRRGVLASCRPSPPARSRRRMPAPGAPAGRCSGR